MDLLNYEVPLWGVAAYWFFMALVSNLPMPKPEERWYSFLFGLLHTLAANVERARIGVKQGGKNGGTIVNGAVAPEVKAKDEALPKQ